ncbi:MAG TPA: NAD(P)/FAD-dependent oxidoreductase [Solirubrobacterales bacterium]|nr:NAD(P)/FAD-dependent oxidoreductase [Solirubrobacterales bacterium]
MAPTDHSPGIFSQAPDYDAVVVGASLAGCSTAILLGRAGARVALIERQPDPAAFKRVCSHFIQASAVPTVERLGLMDEALSAGASYAQLRAWTAWGWIEAPARGGLRSLNLRREVLDPMAREAAASTPGVDLMLGLSAERLLKDGAAVAGVAVRDRDGTETELRAKLTVGADGRDSRIGELSGLPLKTRPHGRVAYGAYFEGAAPVGAPEASIWMLDPQWAAAFPTDSDLTFYAAMVTKDRLPEFKADPEEALVSFLAGLPEAPPIRAGRLASPVVGRIDMTNRERKPVAPGLALVGDAALAVDPLFGVGCGWAMESGEWLADSVAPALRGEEPLERGLRRYRRLRASRLRLHSFLIQDYATGRPLSRFERAMFAAAATDPRAAALFERIGTRQAHAGRTMAQLVPRVATLSARRALGRRRRPATLQQA